jgi:RND superfamily putative drug exporter
MLMNAVSRWVIGHRLTIGLVWIVITIVGIVIAPSVSSRLSGGNHQNTPAFVANGQIAARYGGATAYPGVLVLDLPTGQTVSAPAAKAELAAVDAGLAKAAPTIRTVSYATTADAALVGNGGTSTIVIAYPPHDGDDMSTDVMDALTQAAKAAAPSVTVHATSLKSLAVGNTASGNSSVLGELLIGALGALVVLAWVFGSFLALLPLMMAIVSVLTMQLLIYGLTYLMPASSPISTSAQYIVALLGLGLSIDYSLLVVYRWREERAAGRGNDEAVREAMRRAGHSVWFSGVIASLGLFALSVVPNSLVRGIGISGLFIPSTATLVALTLLPVILSKFGRRLDWPKRSSKGQASRFWTAWSHQVIKHRIAAAVVGLGILTGLTTLAAGITISQPSSTSLATSGAYSDGLHALEKDGFPTGVLTTMPIYVPHAADAASVAASLDGVAGLRGALAPTDPAWQQSGSALVFALPVHEVGSAQTGSTLTDVRNGLTHGALAGGEGAANIDETSSTYSAFPLMCAIIALVTFLLMARGLKSILLPAKAVVLNALSVAASYGILVLIFQHGLGMQTLWGASSYGTIDAIAPILIFGFLFGVSMDYEVFILSRVREAYDRTGSTHEGIIEGVSRTGRLVTSAALILFFALGSLSTTPDPPVREIAAGLAAGVLLDAVVVRMLLLPALVSLFGSANWWMPGWAMRLLRIKPDAPHTAANEIEPVAVRATEV